MKFDDETPKSNRIRDMPKGQRYLSYALITALCMVGAGLFYSYGSLSVDIKLNSEFRQETTNLKFRKDSLSGKVNGYQAYMKGEFVPQYQDTLKQATKEIDSIENRISELDSVIAKNESKVNASWLYYLGVGN